MNACCPIHGGPLDGGPVQFTCRRSGHRVMAADLNHEFQPNDRTWL